MSPRSSRLQRWFSCSLFLGWGAGVLLLVGWMAGRHVAHESTVANAAIAFQQGWQLRHCLGDGDADSRLIAKALAAAGKSSARVAIRLSGDAAPLAAQLRDAGLNVSVDSSVPAGPLPRMEVLDPAGRVVWSGTYAVNELQTPGALLLDHTVLAEVWRGASPRQVPAGCRTPSFLSL